MTQRRPLVLVSGYTSELPDGDSVIGVSAGDVVAGSGLAGGGTVNNNIRLDVELAPNPSGLIWVLNGDSAALGSDGSAQASGTAALSVATNALASGNAALSSSATALASGNAALTSASTAQGTANSALSSGNAALSLLITKLNTYTYTTASGNKTLVDRERTTVVVPSVTLTLPAGPSVGSEVAVSVISGIVDTVVTGNGSNIMQSPVNLTIDCANTTVNLVYVDAARGWRIF